MNYPTKREERRRRAMRAVMLAVGALRDRMFDLYWETPSGEPIGNAWSRRPLRREYDHLRGLWRRLRDDAPEGVFEAGEDEEEIPIREGDTQGGDADHSVWKRCRPSGQG